MKKVLSFTALGLIGLLVAIAAYLYFSFSTLVKSGVETYAPRYTGTAVQLGGVQASLWGGSVAINDFLIGNPAGFNTSHAFRVGTVSVIVDRGSLRSDVIRIREIVIDRPDIIYELGGGSSNLQTIQNNVQAAAGAPGTRPAQEAAAPPSEGRKVVIENLHIRNAQVALSAGMLQGRRIPLPVPDLHLTGLGEKENGVLMADVARQVMDRLTSSITGAASGIDLKGLVPDTEAIQREVERATDGVRREVEGALEGIGGGVQGLFGR